MGIESNIVTMIVVHNLSEGSLLNITSIIRIKTYLTHTKNYALLILMCVQKCTGICIC